MKQGKEPQHKKGRKKIIIIAAVVVIAAAIAAPNAVRMVSGTVKGTPVRTTVVEQGELADSVSVTGTIFSQDVTEIYPEITAPVKEVLVSVGDTVTAGQLLATLNTESLEQSLAQKRASLSTQQATAAQQLADARRALDTYDFNAENEYDKAVLAAESAVTQAELSVETANINLRAARRDLREARDGETEEYVTDQQLQALRDAVSAAEVTLEKAQTALVDAEKDLEATKAGTKDTRADYEAKITTAEIGTNFSEQWLALQALESDITKAEITAPVSGIVTAVIAKEGATATGMLFVIQDADKLKVVTNIKEYDIERVQLNNQVQVKTDATGDEIFEGLLSKIAPTTTRSTTGETSDSTDAEFESEVLVTSGGILRIGMNARLQIITEKKANALYIPFEAIVEDPVSGSPLIYVMRPITGGVFVAKAVPVATGLETDFYTEILSNEILPGDIVILDPGNITDGTPVMAMPGSPAPEPLAESDVSTDTSGEVASISGEETPDSAGASA